MENFKRFNKGDLVTIKYVDRSTIWRHVGLIVEVKNRSCQNPLWDRFLVFINGEMEIFPHRTLVIL